MKPETHNRSSTNGQSSGSSSRNDQEDVPMTMTLESPNPNVLTPTGFSRHELVRLMVQSLQSLGYKYVDRTMPLE